EKSSCTNPLPHRQARHDGLPMLRLALKGRGAFFRPILKQRRPKASRKPPQQVLPAPLSAPRKRVAAPTFTTHRVDAAGYDCAVFADAFPPRNAGPALHVRRLTPLAVTFDISAEI